MKIFGKFTLLLFSAILMFACAPKEKEKKKTSIVGFWQLIDYQDNGKRDSAQLAIFKSEIENMKRMSLEIFDNGTYIRQLDTLSESGKWELDPDGRTFITKINTPQGLVETRLGVELLTQTNLTFRLADVQVVTRLFFARKDYSLQNMNNQ